MLLKLCILQVIVVMANVGLPCPGKCVFYKGHIIGAVCIFFLSSFSKSHIYTQ
jgi:hypothetical protein